MPASTIKYKPMLSFSKIKEHVIAKLDKGLSPKLTYHNLAHTLDVLKQAEIIAKKEGVPDELDLLLLKVSALYHDVGFINVYSGHEEESCRIAEPELLNFGFLPEQIGKVKGMIRATKVPQLPNTLLEQILCDSDLDYLGRNDFYVIGEGLFKEFTEHKVISSYKEWDLLQIRFLEKHHYFTKSAISRRQKEKQQHLTEVKTRVGISV